MPESPRQEPDRPGRVPHDGSAARRLAGRSATPFTALALVCLMALAGCGGGALSPREGCLVFEAGPSLHLYDGEAHALNVLIFPLKGPSAFEQASIDSLIGQQAVDGAAGPAISVMMSPGEVREIREIFPGTTEYLGVVANYYQGGNVNPGNRRAVVAGKCSMFGSDTIKLTARDLLVD